MKRHLSVLACLALVIAMVLSFASCAKIKSMFDKTPEHTHSYVEGKCECGESDPNYVPPHTHNFVEGECECGEKDPNYVAPECEHAYSAEIKQEATCTEAGLKTFTCSVCGHSYDNEIAPYGHDEKILPGVNPSCTATGLTEGKECKVCGVVTVEQIVLNQTAHEFVEGECSCGAIDPDYNGPKTYVLDVQTLTAFAAGVKADGETEVVADFFTIFYSAKTKIDTTKNKTWPDGYTFAEGLRLNWGGTTSVGETTKNAIEIVVDGTATVKVWWICGGDGREIGIFDENGELVVASQTDDVFTEGTEGVGAGKNGVYLSTLSLSEAGKYYIGTDNTNAIKNGGNILCKVEVVVTPVIKNEIKVETTDTYTMYNHDSFTFTAGEEGYYTFKVPAGLGILADGANAPEIDYYDNINGGEFTIGLEAGQEVLFWISAMTKDVWTLEWTFVAGDVEPYVPAGCDHWWMPAMGHPDMVLPTCQAGGVLVQECFMCGEFKIETVGPDTENGHDYVVDLESYVETTCKVDGYQKETCSLCGDVKETTFDHEIYGMHDNVLDEESYKEATCQEAGYSKYTCSVCGEVEEVNEPASEWLHVDVYSSDYSIMVCEICDRVQIGVYVDPTETTFGIQFGMNYGTGAIYFAAFNADNSVFEMYGYTATLVDGVYVITLENNNGYETSAFGLLNATITVKGVCAGVEVTITPAEGEAVSFKTYENEHIYDEGVVTDPTCGAAGYTTYTCACGHSYKEEGAPATGEHDYDHIPHDATCTAAGYVEHICALCDHTYTDGETEALGHADENGDYKCDRCSTKMLPADGSTLTVAQALVIAKMQSHNTYTTQKYYITGIVTNVYNTQYGNFYIKDADGNELCIYGLYMDGTRYDAMNYKPVEGDEVTVYGPLGAYNTTYQMKNAELDDVVAHEHDYKSVVTAPTCVAEGFTTHTCSICKASYTDSKVAALGHTTDNGVCGNCGLTIGGDAPVIGELARFDFGANGSAAHVDGNDYGTSKSFTAGAQTLALTGMSKVYGPAYDAKGNSCIKLGTSSKTGSFTFTVGEDVTEVVIYVAGYKAATSTNIKVNGTQYTVKTASNNGEYTAITIDTTTTKTIKLDTVTYRCMIDAIVFNGVVA